MSTLLVGMIDMTGPDFHNWCSETSWLVLAESGGVRDGLTTRFSLMYLSRWLQAGTTLVRPLRTGADGPSGTDRASEAYQLPGMQRSPGFLPGSALLWTRKCLLVTSALDIGLVELAYTSHSIDGPSDQPPNLATQEHEDRGGIWIGSSPSLSAQKTDGLRASQRRVRSK